MKRNLLKILICPACQGALQSKAFSYSGKREMLEGVLTCKKCGKWYPVINGIPRMMPLSMINKFLLNTFLEKYREKIPKTGTETRAETEKIKELTSKSFGFQWNVFSEMFVEYEKNFLNYIKPLKPSFFKNKVVLDAGCGSGRHTYYAAKYGAEVVGFDLSDAVEAAYKNCRKFEHVHIVQGDIYNPPFRHEFDFIMSIGVLHHLPGPKKGFMSLVNLMKKGTTIFVWLYGREGRWFKIHVVEGIIRKITSRMPHRMLYYLCYLPAGIYHSCNLIYNFLNGNDATRSLSNYVPFKGYARFPFRVKHADAFDLLATPINNYYTRHEVEQWAMDAKLHDVRISDIEGKSWRLFGRR